MKEKDHISNHDQFASTYDLQVKEYKSHGHEVLFGMCYEYIKPGENLLDLGIGTGLSSFLFADAGLEITGLDSSEAMLNECRKKSFARELKQYDIQNLPLPYSDNSFSHVICCGVFHFFDDIFSIFQDVFRILRNKGIFAFTISSPTLKDIKAKSGNIPDYYKIPTHWGIPITKHSDNFIKKLTETLGFEILKEQKLLVYSGDRSKDDILFKTIVTRKKLK